MGQTLSEPVTEKHTSADEDSTLLYGVSEMQGWRISMEDAHATILRLDGDDEKSKISFFAVYDGHGGSAVAKYAGRTVHTRLANTPQFKNADYEAALKRAFLATDEDLREDAAFANDSSGCTAVAALLVPGESSEAARRIIVANAGDSRSVLSLKGEAKPMSYDHKPTNQKETTRIVGAGGFVEFGRVNGNLALSRALGDFEFKGNHSLPPEDQAVTADPDVIVHNITGEEEFLVLACDGIFDCLSNQQVVDFVRRGIANGKELSRICEEAMERCLAPDTDLGGVGSDNMTICVVGLLNGRTKAEWYAWIKERVENKVGWDTPEDIAPVFNSTGSSGGLGAGLRGALGGGAGLGRGAGGAGGGGDGDEGAGGGGGGGLLSGMRFGQGGGGGASMFSALGGFGGGGDDGDEGGPHVINLPASLAGALSSAGIVLRPSRQPNEDGETVYEARYADEDDSEGEGGDTDEDADAAAGSGAGAGSGSGSNARFEEVTEGESDSKDGTEDGDASGKNATTTGAAASASTASASATSGSGDDGSKKSEAAAAASSSSSSSSSAAKKDGDGDDAMTGVESHA